MRRHAVIMEAEFNEWLRQQPWHSENPYVVQGFRLNYVEDGDLFLEGINVNPKMRGNGIARAVMAKLIEITEAHGAPLTREVDETSGSDWILNWYLRLGFEFHDQGPGDYGPYMIRIPGGIK
jgi:ribosomal protein S18 acetylase RimI-like enzyme